MPAFVDPKLEAFAQTLATGLAYRNAANAAGYGCSGGENRKRSERQDVKARVAEIVHSAIWGGTSDLAPVIDALAKVAEVAAAMGTAAGLREARDALAESGRLKVLLRDRAPRKDDLPTWRTLTKEEWLAKHAPPP